MARVTVEDCIQVVTNRFELVALASQRAKAIASGAPITVDRDNDKNVVVALREIAAKTVNIASLREIQINILQRKNKFELLKEDLDNTISKEDEVEIEADLENYEVENIDTIEDHMDEDFSFDADNFDVED